MDDPDLEKLEKISMNLPQKCLFISKMLCLTEYSVIALFLSFKLLGLTDYSNELCGGIKIKGQLMYNDLGVHEIEIITRDKEYAHKHLH